MAYGIVSDFTHSPVSTNICKRPPTLTTISDPYSRFQPFIRIYKKIPNFPMLFLPLLTHLYPSYGATLSLDAESYSYVLFFHHSLHFPTQHRPGLLGMTDAELAAFEADIIATCAEHERSHWRDVDYRACVSLESKRSGSPYGKSITPMENYL
jgi:hypothetical protein